MIRRGYLAFRRRIARLSGARGFDAAGGGRRWTGAQALPALNSSALAGRGPIQDRARYLAGNNPHAAAAVEALASALTGAGGIRPSSAHPDPETRGAVNAAFARWAEDPDGEGRTSLAALQALVARGMVRDGEALIQLRADGGRLHPQMLDPRQLDGALHRDLGGGARIVAGVEFDAAGRRVAYHVFPDLPDLPLAVASLTPTRVPASEILHVFRPQWPGQVRGLSWFAPVALRLADHDAAADALLVRPKVEAQFAGFIYEQGPGAGGFEGERSDGVLEAGMEPGSLHVLRPGQDIKFASPPSGSGAAGDFLRSQLRAIAAGLGLTYEALTGDLSGVNYSSIRAGAIDFRRRMEGVQEQVLIPQLLRPLWRRWLTLEVLSGRLPAPGFEASPADWLAAEFIRPGWPWVDPQNEIAADRLAVEAGFKSRREVVAGRGRELEALDAEIAADGRAPSPAADLAEDRETEDREDA